MNGPLAFMASWNFSKIACRAATPMVVAACLARAATVGSSARRPLVERAVLVLLPAALAADVAGDVRRAARRIGEHSELIAALNEVLPTLVDRDTPLVLDVAVAP